MSDESAQAFLKRPILQRTPPPQAASQNRESPRRKSPTKQVAYEENATIKGTLKSMGTALDALSALFGGQRHITLSMRDELAKIIELQKLLTSLSSPILAAVEVQVTPSLEQRRGKTAGATGESSGVACTPKRMRESLPGPRKTPSKKPRRQGPFTKEAGVAVPHDKEDWTLVKSRQSMSKRSKPIQEPGTMRHLKPRPDAILIEAKENLCQLRDDIGQALGGNLETRALTQEITVERTPPPQAASQNRESPRRKSPTKQVAYEENATIKGTLKSMGTALDALSALFGGQRHITLSMRDELAKIIELQKLLTSLSSPILAAVEVQVTPSLEQRRGKTAGATGESSGVACTPKRMRESLPGPRKTPSKKPRRQGPFTKEAGVAVPHDKEDWTLVKSRQSMSKRSKPIQEPGTMRHLKPRPDAILIEAKAAQTYKQSVRSITWLLFSCKCTHLLESLLVLVQIPGYPISWRLQRLSTVRWRRERTPPPQAASQNRESPRRKSPTKQVAYEENATIKGTLKSMGTALDALSALFGGQRHITLSMRDELAKIIELQKLLTSLSSPILAAVEVQVTPSLEQRRGKTAGATGESSGVACTPKRMRESLPGPRKTPSKKPRRQGPFTKEAGVAVPHDKEDWTLVKSRQSMSKRSKPIQEPGTMRHLKPRPDAILIEAKGMVPIDLLAAEEKAVEAAITAGQEKKRARSEAKEASLDVTPDNLVDLMIERSEFWDATCNFAALIMQELRRVERERNR
ncbi:hypothetical protein ACLKA7_007756 [Drosophila subpalustris]